MSKFAAEIIAGFKGLLGEDTEVFNNGIRVTRGKFEARFDSGVKAMKWCRTIGTAVKENIPELTLAEVRDLITTTLVEWDAAGYDQDEAEDLTEAIIFACLPAIAVDGEDFKILYDAVHDVIVRHLKPDTTPELADTMSRWAVGLVRSIARGRCLEV